MRTGTTWNFGQRAETAVAIELKREGWFVTDTCKIDNGGAPKALGLIKSMVLPDHLAIKAGAARWAETKYKDSPAWYRIEQCYRHGIDLPHWRDYLTIENESGFPGDLFIIQEKPNNRAPPDPVLLAQSFRHLQKTVAQTITPNMREFAGVRDFAPRGIVYWRIQSFDFIKNIDFERPEAFSAKEKWEAWRDARNATEPQAATVQKTREPEMHLCPICGQFGAYGFHAPLPLPHGWFCREHQPIEHGPR